MCTSLRLYEKEDGRFIMGPCKTCIECRNMRRQDFENRIKFEIQDFNYVASFISLTYRDDELPILLPEGSAIVGKYFGSIPPAYGSTLYPTDISNFCDKMQKRMKRKYGYSGKYIAVGEYGDDNHRPHFHIIYAGLPSGGTRKEVYDCWNKGNIDIRPVDKGAVRYVLDYIDKQVFGAKSLYEQYGDFYPPFAHFSKGLGFNWINEHLEDFNEYGELIYGDSGKKIILNPYLKDKYNFKDKPYNKFPESVIEYAKINHIKDLNKAAEQRSKIMKTKYEHDMINKRTGLINSDKLETQAAKDRYFQKYGEELIN